jgi:hypothetical protein
MRPACRPRLLTSTKPSSAPAADGLTPPCRGCPAGTSTSSNRRRKVVKKTPARKCSKMVGPWQQCGGRATNVWANQVDKPWPGHCCKTLLSCQRSSQYYWSCKR